MLRIFNSNNPALIFLLALLGAALRLHYFMHPPLPVLQNTDVLGYYVCQFVFKPIGLVPLAVPITALIFTLVQALYFNTTLLKHRLIPNQNYYPALIYVVVSALLPEWCTLSIPLVISFFIIWLFNRLITLYRKEKMYGEVFDVGLIIGVTALCYTSMIWLALFIVFIFFILRAFVIREWLNVFVGILVPAFLIGTWLFYTDSWSDLLKNFIGNISFHNQIIFTKNLLVEIGYGYFVGLFLFLFLVMQSKQLSRVVLVRKVFWLWFHYSWVMLAAYFFNPDRSLTHFYLFIIPLTFYLSYYLCIEKNKWIRESILLLFIVLIFAQQFILK